MTRRGSAAVAALVAVIGTAGWIASAQQAPDAESLTFLGEPITAAQLALGQQLYAANCASCHGANLEGQPDWRRRNENGRMPAPPHDAGIPGTMPTGHFSRSQSWASAPSCLTMKATCRRSRASFRTTRS